MDHRKSKKEFQKNLYFCFIDSAKGFDFVDHNNLWKILKEMELLDHLPASWWICVQVKKQQLELDMEQQTVSKLGKGYAKAVYCHGDDSTCNSFIIVFVFVFFFKAVWQIQIQEVTVILGPV